MATTTPNFGWDIPQSSDLVKDGATAIAALGTDIDTALVDLKGGMTGQVLSKASNTDLDFTWTSETDPTAIQKTIIDAKGDLISATAADTPARLAVGTNGQYLVADSTTSTGLKWQTLSVSSGCTLISRTTFSAAANVTVDSLFSSTYENYIVFLDIDVSAGTDLNMRGRYGTTTHTGLNYQFGFSGINSSSATLRTIYNFDASAWNLGTMGSGYNNPYEFRFHRTNGSSQLHMTANFINRSNSYMMSGGGFIESSQSWTGLYFYPNTGTITGRISVYGLASV